MKVSEAVASRRSMRNFKPDPVPHEDIVWLLQNAGRAASNGNVQPWKVHVTSGERRLRLSRAILDGIAAGEPDMREYTAYPEVFRPIYGNRRKAVGKQLYTLLGVPRGDEEGMARQFRKNFDFFGAPVGLIVCLDRDMGDGQWVDIGIFLDTLMLLARERGLHSCAQGAFCRYPQIIRRELSLPPEEVVICGVAIGYADPDAVPNNLIAERAPLSEWVTWHS